MSTITIHAGDYPLGRARLGRGEIKLPIGKGQGYLTRERLALDEIELLEVATEASVRRLGGALGWGAAGAALFGPAGLVAGALLGGRDTEVTFVARTRDGRRMLATTDLETWKRLAAALF